MGEEMHQHDYHYQQHQQSEQERQSRSLDTDAMSDNDETADARELAHLLSDDDERGERGASSGSYNPALFTESVMAIVSKIAAANGTDEYE